MISIPQHLWRRLLSVAVLVLLAGCTSAPTDKVEAATERSVEAPTDTPDAPTDTPIEPAVVAPIPTVPEAPAKSTSAPSFDATIDIDTSRLIRSIPRTLYGTNIEWKWNAYMLWQEEQQRLDPELVHLAKQLGASPIRYPGGILSDMYHWKDGVGPKDQRPVVLHRDDSNNKSRPNFGTDEALEFARQTGGELLITVNAATGTPSEAADWVGYVKGKLPRVRFWEVGNEFYIKQKKSTIDAKSYAERFLEFAAAMRAADRRIELGAIGGVNTGRYAVMGYPDWNRTVLEAAGEQIDFLAVHNGYAPVVSKEREMEKVYRAMLAAPVLIARNLQKVSEDIERYAPEHASEISIAVTEWGPAFRFGFDSPLADHAKTLGSALYTASALQAFIRSPRTEIANFWMLHDISVLGSIGSTSGSPTPEWAPTARYYALQLFSRYFGDQLVTSSSEGPTFDSRAVGIIDAVRDVPYLDIVSSLSDDGQRLYILVVNKHFDDPIAARITLQQFLPAATATAWTLGGRDIGSHTGTRPLEGLPIEKQVDARGYSEGKAGAVTFTSSPVEGVGEQFTYSFPAHSVTSLVLTRR